MGRKSVSSSISSSQGRENKAFENDEKIDIEAAELKKEKKKDEWEIDWETEIDTVPWNTLTTKEKAKAITINTTKCIFALGCLYLFICSIGMLGDAFQVLAGKTAGEIFSDESFLSNPITGFIIGILVTVLVQSSSTSTSIVITMVAANILTVELAIPIIMGTNIGTSVTNTLVALSQSMDKSQFKKAFAGATVHDLFNLLAVLVLLPLEIASGYLYIVTKAIIDSFDIQSGEAAPDFLKVITDPLVGHIVQVNKSVIEKTADGTDGYEDASMISICCGTTATSNCTSCTTSDFLFADTGLSDAAVGGILLVISLVVLSGCLIGLVKALGSMLKGTVANLIKKIINLDFPYPFGWVTGYLALLAGAGLTFLVQSSSVFTSTLTPLVGLGIIGVERMYPLTLGSNIGTTTTSILAALASDPDQLESALQVSLVHLFFNLTGIVLFYPVPFMRLPIPGCKKLGETAAEYRWFAVLYLIGVFFLIPGILLGFSFVSEWFAVGVVCFFVLIGLLVALVTTIQRKRAHWLPKWLRTWKFLPRWMRSLKPYDRFFSKYLLCCKSCRPTDESVEKVSMGSLENSSSSNSMEDSSDVADVKSRTLSTRM